MPINDALMKAYSKCQFQITNLKLHLYTRLQPAHILGGQNDCNFFYLTTKKVLGTFKMFLKISMEITASCPPGCRPVCMHMSFV